MTTPPLSAAQRRVLERLNADDGLCEWTRQPVDAWVFVMAPDYGNGYVSVVLGREMLALGLIDATPLVACTHYQITARGRAALATPGTEGE